MPREFEPAEQAELLRKAEDAIQGLQGRGSGHQADGSQPDGHDDPTGRQLTLTPASKMQIRVTKWLWDWRIPSRAIVLLAGREGIGKSTCAITLAAQVTRGNLPGRYKGTPRGVVIVATEDTWAEVIVPRLIAAGADLELVYRVDVAEEDHSYGTLSLPADLRQLEQLCLGYNIGLVICDPLMSLIHGSLDTHRDQQVRKALDPLAEFADRAKVAILAVIHVSKRDTTDPLTAMTGSRAFAAVARGVLFCTRDPEDPDLYLLGHTKSNLGPEQETITYRIETYKIQLEQPDEDGDDLVTTSKITFGDPDARTIQDVMAQAAENQRRSGQGENANKVLDWVVEQDRTVSRKEVGEQFPDIKTKTLDSLLSRLVARNQLTKPLHGHFVVSRPVNPALPSLGVVMQEVQELQDDLAIPAPPALPAPPGGMQDRPGRSEPQSRPVTDVSDKKCRICHYPLATVYVERGWDTHPNCRLEQEQTP